MAGQSLTRMHSSPHISHLHQHTIRPLNRGRHPMADRFHQPMALPRNKTSSHLLSHPMVLPSSKESSHRLSRPMLLPHSRECFPIPDLYRQLTIRPLSRGRCPIAVLFLKLMVHPLSNLTRPPSKGRPSIAVLFLRAMAHLLSYSTHPLSRGRCPMVALFPRPLGHLLKCSIRHRTLLCRLDRTQILMHRQVYNNNHLNLRNPYRSILLPIPLHLITVRHRCNHYLSRH